ncbi:MAG TPA: V-type ATP synthase subunit K [Deinococcales bacterium]|nr:V-type ATP synthase subunit K [Deinococcales bacterium]
MKKFAKIIGLVALIALLGMGLAQEAEVAAEAGRSLGDGLVALAAALAIGVGAIAVAIAQAAIGSAGAGTLAEKPEAFGQILIYLVIPETLIIFAFVIAFFINNQIG